MALRTLKQKMPHILEPCVVCSKAAIGYNYGALVCSACKMFFKRVLDRNTIKNCRNHANCEFGCSFCRFQKCLHVGMIYNPYSKTYDFQNHDIILSAILKNLTYLDNYRQHLFVSCYFKGDPSIHEISEPLTFLEKPKDFVDSYQNWAFMSSLTSLEYFRKLAFMKKLEAADQVSILQNAFKQFSLFSIAQASFESKKSCLEFPDGAQVPIRLEEVSQSFRNRIQCRMVGRMIELKVTREEFLLLSVIFICNPGAPNLSSNGSVIVLSQQKYYTAALLHYCAITYRKSGPSRFTDLLFLFQVIQATFDDLAAHHQLRKLHHKSNIHSKKIFQSPE